MDSKPKNSLHYLSYLTKNTWFQHHHYPSFYHLPHHRLNHYKQPSLSTFQSFLSYYGPASSLLPTTTAPKKSLVNGVVSGAAAPEQNAIGYVSENPILKSSQISSSKSSFSSTSSSSSLSSSRAFLVPMTSTNSNTKQSMRPPPPPPPPPSYRFDLLGDSSRWQTKNQHHNFNPHQSANLRYYSESNNSIPKMSNNHSHHHNHHYRQHPAQHHNHYYSNPNYPYHHTFSYHSSPYLNRSLNTLNNLSFATNQNHSTVKLQQLGNRLQSWKTISIVSILVVFPPLNYDLYGSK